MLIRNLAGVFTGMGFLERNGRRPRIQDCGFVPGPVDVTTDESRGVILAVGRRLETASPGECIVDGHGLIALPGFIDSHTHAVFAGDRSAEFFQRWEGRTYREIAAAGGGIHSTTRATGNTSDSILRNGLRTRLRRMLATGTTTVEVKSGYSDSAAGELRLLRLIKAVADDVNLPRVVPTFLALHAIPPGRTEREFCDEMIDVLPVVASERLARFADSFPERGFFSLEEAARFSRAALGHGLGVKVHADELTDLGTSGHFIREGAASIDHLQHISPEAVDALGAAETVATLLPATSFFLGLPYANARRLLDSGARVALASDYNPGTAPSPDVLFTALLAAAQMKMTPAEILCGLTFNAASAVGLNGTHGLIAPGYAADINFFASSSLDYTDPESWLAELFLHRVRPMFTAIRGSEVGACAKGTTT